MSVKSIFAKTVFYAVRQPCHWLRLFAWVLGDLAERLGSFAQHRIGNAIDRYQRMRPKDHYLPERYAMNEKPPGWNDAVLGYFHRGPEGRCTRGAFADAFHERAAAAPTLWPSGPPRETISRNR